MADDDATSKAPSPAETGYTPGEGGFTRWWNFFSLLTGQMTAEGKRQYRVDAEQRHASAHCRNCEKNRDYLLKYSPVIRYMSDEISRLGGRIDRGNIYCMPCGGNQRHSGGFHPRLGIKLCANEMRNRGHVEDTLAHEMIHVWDHLRFKLDWRGNPRHQACSEIRASSLSGECRFWREFATRGQWRVAQQHQECVRRRAALSLAARPDVRDDVHAARIVNEVWESCFPDTRPFDEIYR